MSKNALIVLSFINRQKSVSEVAKECGVSRTWVYELLQRHKLLGPQPFEKRPRAHHNDPSDLSDDIHELIASLRHQLSAQG